MKPYRVIVTGDRHWNCQEVAARIIVRLRTRYGPGLVIVHGAAPGVDSSFAKVCETFGVRDEPHPADWKAFGNAAGPRRNAEMVNRGAEFCLAVHRNLATSLGTRDCIRRCLAIGIPVWHFDSGDGDAIPRRLTSLEGPATAAEAPEPDA